jgi:stage II sporulation protein D
LRSAIAAAYLSKSPRSQPHRILGACLAATLAAVSLAVAAPARGAAIFYIRGGGDGHGIGMSQYGAYGYALHGKGYRWILAHYYQGTSLGQVSPRRTVRVLVGWGAATFSGASNIGGHKLKPSLSYVVSPNADGTLTVSTLAGKKVATFAAPFTATGPGPLSLAGAGTYRGALEFRPTGSGSGIETVNVVSLDDYVRGVISAEMPSTWSPEALKVQAVAARTYAITSDAGGAVFDLYDDTRSQMYGGVGAETPATDAAVAATRGQVVTYHGTPVVTYFFSSSGGHTENVENVWPGATPEPWLRGVADPYDNAGGDPYHRWGSQMTVTTAAGKLHAYVKGRLLGVRVLTRGTSPRILTAEVLGTRGNSDVTGIQLQQAFGLMTTYASFTTISSLPGRARLRLALPARLGSSAEAQAVLALVPLVQALVAGTVSGIHGTVVPASSGTRIGVQQFAHGTWRTVLHTRLRAGGAFDTGLPGPGTYRIVYRGLDGPSVKVR